MSILKRLQPFNQFLLISKIGRHRNVLDQSGLIEDVRLIDWDRSSCDSISKLKVADESMHNYKPQYTNGVLTSLIGNDFSIKLTAIDELPIELNHELVDPSPEYLNVWGMALDGYKFCVLYYIDKYYVWELILPSVIKIR